MSVDEQLIGLNLMPTGVYTIAPTGGGGGGGGGGGAGRDNRVQKYFKYGFIDKKMKKNEVGYLYENQMKEVFDAFLNARQVGQGITTLPCAGATCALPDLGLVSGEFDNEAHTVSILDSNLNLCALELKTSAGADFGQIAFEAVISPRIGWRIASKSKTAAGSPLWSKAVFDGAIIPHLEKMWPLENIAEVYATKGGPVYLKRLGFNIVVRDGAVLLKGMRPIGIGEDITTFAQMLEFFSNVGNGRWLTLYRSWYAKTARSRNSDELTSQQRNAFTKYLWDSLKQESMFHYGPDSEKFKRETPMYETENQKKKRIGAAKTEAKRHATANMVYLMEDAKRFAGIHPQQEALRAGSAGGGGGGRSSRSPPAFSQPPIAARTLGGSPTREGGVDGKAADQLRRILQERFGWKTHSRNALELHIPATKQTISPYYLMKGCQFIQIGSGTNVGLYSLGGPVTIDAKQILSFNDVIARCDYRIRMKAGDSFFRTHDFKLAIKIVFRNTLPQNQRVNLNLSEDRNAFLGWLIGMYSQQKAMGYNYAHAFPWEVVELSLPEPLMNNRARQQAKASAVALAGLGGRRQSGASLVRGGGGGGGGGAASFFSPLKSGGRNQARAPTAAASAQRIAAAAARASAQRIAAAAERAADQRRAAAAAAATREQAAAARTARRNARERSGGYQRRTKRRKKRKRTKHKKRRKRKKTHRRRRRTRRKKY